MASGAVSSVSASEARWSTSTWVTSASASTFFLSCARLSEMNPFTSPSALARLASAAPSSSRSAARNPLTSASCRSASRICPSFSRSITLNLFRLAMVAYMSPLESASVCDAFPRSAIVVLRARPLPPRLAAPTRITFDSAPLAFSPCGPRSPEKRRTLS